LDQAILHGVHGGLGQAGAAVFKVAHPHEPLIGKVRLELKCSIQSTNCLWQTGS
jgi:hypothetical protein